MLSNRPEMIPHFLIQYKKWLQKESNSFITTSTGASFIKSAGDESKLVLETRVEETIKPDYESSCYDDTSSVRSNYSQIGYSDVNRMGRNEKVRNFNPNILNKNNN